jgi:predicted GNAT family acetyltransferase
MAGPRPPTITREDHPTRGRYVARVEGIDAEAELTYSRSSPTVIIAEHTEVPDDFRGQGIGRLLARRMVEDARAEGVKIVALCQFVNAERSKHPDWAEVFAN